MLYMHDFRRRLTTTATPHTGKEEHLMSGADRGGSSARPGDPALRAVRDVATWELRLGDVIDWHGERRRVTQLADTGQPAAFGTGTAWEVTLGDEAGRLVPLMAARGQRWLRL